MPHFPQRRFHHVISGGKMVASEAYGLKAYGFRSGGSGGASRINVMVTRRLAGSVGSSGNSGWLSALPATAKMWDGGKPSRSRIWRTALERSAERSKAP